MIDEPTIVQTESETAAVVRVTIRRDEIQNVMNSVIQEVTDTVVGQGIGPAGPVFSFYLNLEPETFDFEIGVPVSSPVKPAGRVQAGELPAFRALRTFYTGPYDGLDAAWSEFMTLIKQGGYERGSGLWERYLIGPDSEPDPAAWRTELNCALAD